MRTLEKALRAFPRHGVFIRNQVNNKVVLSGATDSLSPVNLETIRLNKALLILITPEGNDYSIKSILLALEQAIRQSDALIIDAGYELHSADLKSIDIARAYLTDSNNK